LLVASLLGAHIPMFTNTNTKEWIIGINIVASNHNIRVWWWNNEYMMVNIIWCHALSQIMVGWGLVSQSQNKLQQVELSGTTLFRAVYPGGNWAGLFLFLQTNHNSLGRG
jgi:hypothetical protein